MPEAVRSEPEANELSVSDTRAQLADLVSRAHYNGRITYVTRRGQRLAAIVPAEVAEAIERAEDAADIAAADAAMARIESGEDELISFEQLKAELGL